MKMTFSLGEVLSGKTKCIAELYNQIKWTLLRWLFLLNSSHLVELVRFLFFICILLNVLLFSKIQRGGRLVYDEFASRRTIWHPAHLRNIQVRASYLVHCFFCFRFISLFLFIGEVLQILIFARHSWALSSEASLLACHTHCETGHRFIIVISEDPGHSHLLPGV